jgi:DNA-directed RNA polymerase specialized sigma24 family protein
MASDNSEDRSGSHDAARFATTHWSVVFTAGQAAAGAREAVEQLCRTYWYPLYAHVRHRGYSVEDAQDLTQAFFAHLLEKERFTLANPARGKFRTFLLTALDHFLVNEWHRLRAEKRGGRHRLLSLDHEAAEQRFSVEPATNETPDRLFEKRWAAALLDKVLADLEEECQAAGKGAFFVAARGLLWGDQDPISGAELAAQCGLTGSAGKSAIHRLRRRYRALLRAEVARTVSTPEEIDGELRDLIAVLSG